MVFIPLPLKPTPLCSLQADESTAEADKEAAEKLRCVRVTHGLAKVRVVLSDLIVARWFS